MSLTRLVVLVGAVLTLVIGVIVTAWGWSNLGRDGITDNYAAWLELGAVAVGLVMAIGGLGLGIAIVMTRGTSGDDSHFRR